MFRTIIALLFSLPYLLGAKTVLEDLETELKNIVQKVSPSIVVVESQKDDQGIKYASTGFVFDDKGDIVTLTEPSSDAKNFNVVSRTARSTKPNCSTAMMRPISRF